MCQIKNDSRLHAKLSSLSKYTAYETVKLIGFRDSDMGLDSLLDIIAHKIQPRTLIFENCDLSVLSSPVAVFTRIEELQLIKNCLFYESGLFYAFKSSPVKKLIVQRNNASFVTDSLHLFSSLSSVEINNTLIFKKINRKETYRILSGGNLRDVNINYYGDLYKENKIKEPVVVKKPVIPTVKQSPGVILTPKPYACIRQPLPGININDTVYSFNPGYAQSFYYESGSKIMLDKDAFTDSNGLAYVGPVDLFYREFRTPVEIMLSGIPMKTTVEGQEKLFKSGGMYEIRAYDRGGNELKARSDTSVKINFALTDTSSEFQFFSLNTNGSWTTKEDKVNQVPSRKASDALIQATKAIIAYNEFLTDYRRIQDTTDFYARFKDAAYLYVYRRDNMHKHRKDTANYTLDPWSKTVAKGFFRVRYVKQTKDKEIIFMLVPTTGGNYYHEMPSYIRALINQEFLYTGSMTKEEFKRTFHKKLYGWDLRCQEVGEELHIDVKTKGKNFAITCKAVSFFKDGSFKLSNKLNSVLAYNVNRYMARSAKHFNKNLRSGDQYLNAVNPSMYGERSAKAFQYCKKFQNETERKMSFDEWQKYIRKVAPDYYMNAYQNNNAVGTALVKSDMGVKNIDCYLHSGEMENILVNYKGIDLDTLDEQYHAVLFKSINTSYPLSKNSYAQSSLKGYYFKSRPNYVIRFSKDGFMQVTRTKELNDSKINNEINLEYQRQYNVSNLTSDAITKLIMD